MDLTRSQKTTLYTTLLASFLVLLHRYTGQDDIVVGSATSGRPKEFAGVVGYFVNPVPIRADLSGDPDFLLFIEQVRKTVLNALEHQQFPFPLLVERLQTKRDHSRSPIFQVDFALRQHPHRVAGQGIPFEPFELHEEEGQFDLSLHITDNENGLAAAFKYNKDLFSAGTVERMADCFRVLLEELASNPCQRVSAIPLLSHPERDRILAYGAGEDVPYPPTCVHQMFEQQAARTPDAVAVELFGRQEESRLSYDELNRRSNQVARRLRACGVGPEILVGACLERSEELVTALLGVLKAGGAYLPLDPAYPGERLVFMVRDAQAPVLITSRALAETLPNVESVRFVFLDEVHGENDCNLPCPVAPENLAYVIYTSGSTGRPKGAMITHRGLTNYLSWCIEEYKLRDGCGAPVSSSISFDATITSFWSPLVTGGKVILPPEEHPIESLAEILRSNRGLSLVKITPAHLEILSQILPADECAGRANAFVIGGEALRGDMLSFWQQFAPETRLINEYGPTETVVGCCIYEASERTPDRVPIGRPIANTQLYVLDRNLEPVPLGVVGELYIGGAGVARGYLNRPGVTASRFVPDRFSGRPGARLYRTGDLVRYLPDGNLEFLGRSDTQVKIRGYRIEPGEIESLLTQHSNVSDCVVMAREESGTQYLAAYVVPAGESATVSELRRYLAGQLPEYMIPSFFITLSELPLTPNGKVDFQALPRPEHGLDESSFVAPRDPLEVKLAAVWEEVLGVRRVGVKDNFFDLGGHSLLAVRLMSRIQQEFGDGVPLATILRGPTVEQLARILRQKTPSSLKSCLVPMQPGGTRPPLYCVPGAGGNAIYLYNLARELGPNQPFYGLQGVGLDGDAEPHTTVEDMAAHYIAEIRSVQPVGPYHLAGHSLGGWVAFEMARQLQRDGREVSMLAIIDTPVPVPGSRRDLSNWDSARWIAELTDRIAQLLNPALKISAATLQGLNCEEQLGKFRDELVSLDLFPREAAVGHLRSVLELFKAHSQVQYEISRCDLQVPITLFRTEAVPAHLSSLDGDPTWGWGALGKVDVHEVPGEHLTVLRPPHVKVLAEKLGACLSEAVEPVLMEV